MKKFITLLLCFQFLVFPVSMSYGSDSTIDGIEAEVEGDPTLTEQRQFEGIGWDFVFKQLVVLGVALVGSNIWLQCPQSLIFPSVIAMEAATVAYLASEIFGASEFGEVQKAALNEIKMGDDELIKKGTQEQKDILDAKLTNERNLRNFLENKKIWIGSIHAAFLIALGFAIAEATSEKFLEVMTIGGLTAAKGVSAADCSNPIKSKGGIIAASIAISAAYGLMTGFGSSSGMISGVGSALVGLLSLFGNAISPIIGFAAAESVGRVVTMGAFVGLLIPVELGLYERADKAQQNINDMKKVIKDFKVLSEEDSDEGVGTDTGELPTQTQKTGVLKKTATNNVKSSPTCFGSDGSVSTSSCKNPRKFAKPDIDFGDLNTLNTGFSELTDMANSAASGNMAAASAKAGNLASMAGNLRKVVKKLMKNMNEQRKADGKEPFDFNKEFAKKAAEFQGGMTKALASKGFTAPTSAGLATLDTETPTPTVAAAPVAAPAAPSADKKPSFDFGLDDEETPQEGGSLGDVAQTGDGIDKFDANVADISNKTDVSIFVQLSNRYLLNYNKIFKKVEEKPKVEEPKKEESAKK